MFDCFAVATPGLEEIVAGELEGLKVKDANVVDGGVEFTASRSRSTKRTSTSGRRAES